MVLLTLERQCTLFEVILQGTVSSDSLKGNCRFSTSNKSTSIDRQSFCVIYTKNSSPTERLADATVLNSSPSVKLSKSRTSRECFHIFPFETAQPPTFDFRHMQLYPIPTETIAPLLWPGSVVLLRDVMIGAGLPLQRRSPPTSKVPTSGFRMSASTAFISKPEATDRAHSLSATWKFS